ncbi:PREDICTED: acetyl-coenzyme A transporter 1-like [Diuraphis noxia]|uniref:acetyl-coenzyme A transporter 1-like n=1 Tax=Diuraphis noxia TaxID=143948 RepID=UPI0007636D1D|nr:PREDICTED: acetyl-coenzyme A transporter 1-like [Diuraphis noxia]XP_015372740.1 PREDICTED: acetyl-coenzyme A transporter 1-like [Diuraphis noxia]XP_015372741.1 PREDICTED: acetyl-coenzyme A transporter 1-like [Diuraphis noxia]
MDMGLVDLESAYRDVNVVIAKPIAENGREDQLMVEPVVNVEWRNGDDKTSSEIQKDIKSNLKGDMLNVALLIVLYMLQGIPIGISLAIRTYMQNRKVSYVQQAKFSVVDLPYSLKLLWAPLVDVVYSRRMGKRKSWLVPVQFCIGLSLIFIASNINNWLMENDTYMTTLTYVFFCVNALAATNDITIDGWSLTLLRRENVGYASTCNTSGQALGIAFGYVMFILFESEEFCNKWLRFTAQKGGMISMEGYLYFWGIIFTVASTSIAFFVKDRYNQADKISQININQIYKLLWKIINLRTMKIFTLVMLAYEMSFSSMGSFVSNPKFMEYGVAKEEMALVDLSLIPIKIFIPILISKYTSGPRPLKILYKTVPYRLVLGISSGVLVYYTPYFIGGEYHNWTVYFFLIYELHRILRLVLLVVVYLSVRSFFLQISDPRIGGTYMSLLNTVWYLGIAVSRITALGMLNLLTIKQCSADRVNECRFKTANDEDCEKFVGVECVTVLDGYFVEVVFCTVSGVAWYLALKKIIENLQSREKSDWQVNDVGLIQGVSQE